MNIHYIKKIVLEPTYHYPWVDHHIILLLHKFLIQEIFLLTEMKNPLIYYRWNLFYDASYSTWDHNSKTNQSLSHHWNFASIICKYYPLNSLSGTHKYFCVYCYSEQGFLWITTFPISRCQHETEKISLKQHYSITFLQKRGYTLCTIVWSQKICCCLPLMFVITYL